MKLRARAVLTCAIVFGIVASSFTLPIHANTPSGTRTYSETNSGSGIPIDSRTPTIEPPLRALWTRGSERFQRQWLIAGPVDAAAAAAIDPVSLRPEPGQPLDEQMPHVRWTAHTSWGDITDLTPIVAPTPLASERRVDRFVFVAASIPRKQADSLELAIGSERPYSVWLNGEPVHESSTADLFVPDRDRIPVKLRKGENVALLRFRETSPGTSQFSLRVVPRGAALRRLDEIAPSILETDGNSLAVRTHFTAEPNAAPVTLEVIRAGGAVMAQERAARGSVVHFNVETWPDGAYEIRASTSDAWNQPAIRHLPWYKGDARAAVRELLAAAQSAPRDPYGDTIRMLAAMTQNRLGDSLERASAESWRVVHSPLMEFEELRLEAQGHESRIRAGGFVRIFYTDTADGSTQFCRAYLPIEYSANKSWPLITFLHGYNDANPDYFNWWSADERHHRIADTKRAIAIEPHGRGNAQYLGIGERDVLRCIAEAKRMFAVDEDRIYLTGESMGGHGTWWIASRHPDLFAAAAPVYGGWDFRVTNVSGPALAAPPRTPSDAFSFERSSSFAQAENLLHVPLLIVHGDADEAVSVENSRHAVKLLQRWGYNVRYHEMPGWAHEELGQRATIADWLLTHKRASSPKTVRLRAPDLAAASAYWLTVRMFENPAEVIRVDAEVLQPGVVKVDTSNVAAFSLDLPSVWRGASGTVQVIWNGEAHQRTAKEGPVVLGTVPQSGLYKRAGLEGPLPAVIATPFALVVGTISSDARMSEIIHAHADRFVQQWRNWQHQTIRVFKDSEITQAEEQAYSLILLGGANENAVTKRLAKELPFSASKAGIVVDGRRFDAADAVLQAIYPSPLAEDRYVYVVVPTSTNGMYFWQPQIVNFQLGNSLTMFDWLIQDGRRPPPGTTVPHAAHVASGVFDASWRRQDRWTLMRDEAEVAQWTRRKAPPKHFAPSPAALEAVAGRYELFPGLVVTFRADGGKLVVDIPGERSIVTIAESESIFVDPASGNMVEFLRDEHGAITAASVDGPGGAILLAKRLP